MPPKRQVKAWQELLANIQQERIDELAAQQMDRLTSIRELQAEIARLEAKGPNEGRSKQIRLLRRQIESLT